MDEREVVAELSRVDPVADGRIVGDAALEEAGAGLALDLADEIDRGDQMAGSSSLSPGRSARRVTTPMTVTGPERIAANLPTVMRASSDDGSAASLIAACEPVTEMTVPIGTVSAREWETAAPVSACNIAMLSLARLSEATRMPARLYRIPVNPAGNAYP